MQEPSDNNGSPMSEGTPKPELLALRNKLEERLKSITKYLTPLLPLANCHMVEFLTKNHWEKVLPENLRKELEDFEKTRNFGFTLSRFWADESTLCKDNTILAVFIQRANCHSLNEVDSQLNKYSITVEQLQDMLKSWGGEIKPEINITAFMNDKKSYEVATMSRLVASVYDTTSSTCCLEAGGGRGHLLVALSLGYRIPSLTVDCDEGKLRAATERVKLIQKQWRAIAKQKKANETVDPKHGKDGDQQVSDTELHSARSHESLLDSTNPDDSTSDGTDSKDSEKDKPKSLLHPDTNPAALHRFAAAYITRDSDLVALVEDKFPELVDNVKVLLTGLHTCGDLGSSSLRIFASQPSSAALFNVPCCYNLLTEGIGNNSGFPMSKYLKGFKLGRNARMLATQPLDRVVKEQKLPPKSLLYRAMLEVLIRDYTCNVRVTMENKLKAISSKCDNFEQYLKMADGILQLNLSNLPRSVITKLCKDMALQWRRLVTVFLLRMRLAPVIETLILLDRLLFLVEKDYEKVFLVKLFDPVLSPRCHGVVAFK